MTSSFVGYIPNLIVGCVTHWLLDIRKHQPAMLSNLNYCRVDSQVNIPPELIIQHVPHRAGETRFGAPCPIHHRIEPPPWFNSQCFLVFFWDPYEFQCSCLFSKKCKHVETMWASMLKQVLNRVLIPNFCFTCVLILLPKFPKHPASGIRGNSAGATPPGCHHRVHPHVHPSHGYRTNWAWPCRRSTWQLGWVQWATCRAQTQKLDKITWKMLVSNMVWLKMSFKFGGVSQTWINLGGFYLMKKRL